MARRKSRSKVGEAISYIVVLLVLVAVIGFFATATGGFEEEFQTFYVNVNGTKVDSKTESLILEETQPLNFDVCYIFGKYAKDLKGYSISIKPNKDNDFLFYIDEAPNGYSVVTELKDCFEIEYLDEGFIVNYDNIKTILQRKYPDNVVDLDRELVDYTKPLFHVYVTSYDGKSTVCIPLGMQDCGIDSLTLDTEEFYF